MFPEKLYLKTGSYFASVVQSIIREAYRTLSIKNFDCRKVGLHCYEIVGKIFLSNAVVSSIHHKTKQLENKKVLSYPPSPHPPACTTHPPAKNHL
jgi:hypothetical protein